MLFYLRPHLKRNFLYLMLIVVTPLCGCDFVYSYSKVTTLFIFIPVHMRKRVLINKLLCVE